MIFAMSLCLLTTNVPKLAEFYKMILQTTSDCEDEIHQVIMTTGAGLTIYNNGDVKMSKNENMIIAFTVENVDDEFKRLQQLGVKVIEPPTTRPWGARNMLFDDPDGNHIIFRTPAQ